MAAARIDTQRNLKPPAIQETKMQCRSDCGACCTAPSISSPIPGMPQGKPAGVRCIQLTEHNLCAIFGQKERPACCGGLQPSFEMCGSTREEAMVWLAALEVATAPSCSDDMKRRSSVVSV